MVSTTRTITTNTIILDPGQSMNTTPNGYVFTTTGKAGAVNTMILMVPCRVCNQIVTLSTTSHPIIGYILCSEVCNELFKLAPQLYQGEDKNEKSV